MVDEPNKTLLEKWTLGLKNNPVVVVILVAATAVSGIGAFTDAFKKSVDLIHLGRASSQSPTVPQPPVNQNVQISPQIQVNPTIQVSPTIQVGGQKDASSLRGERNSISPDIATCIPQMRMLQQIRGAESLEQAARLDPKWLALGLVDAAQAGNLSCVKFLIQKGAPPNGIKSTGDSTEDLTPLVAGAQAPSVEVVRVLLDAEANPNLRALKGHRPEDVGSPPVVVAAASNSREMLRLFLKKEVDINAADGSGLTALHWAAFYGDLESVKELVRLGAKTNVKDRFGQQTPLDKARYKKNVSVISFLESK